MSFLYFDRYSPSSFTSRLSNDVEEENSEDENGAIDDGSPFSHVDDDSSFGLPSDASLTDHQVITGFPPGYLHEVYRENHLEQDDGSSFGGNTILSSAPSDESMFPPLPQVEQLQPIIISSHPPFNVGSALSITTTESEYRNWQSLENSVVNDGDTVSAPGTTSELSFSALELSSLPSSIVHSMNDESSERALVLHDGTAYRNVADRLALEGSNGEWFSRFTEQDWINFRIAADMVLQALEPSSSSPCLALPPPVPTFATDCVISSSEYNMRNHLSEEFLCCLCQDAIVGATTLSCACDKSTVCAECWEAYRIVEVSLDSDFVRIETRSTCPSCQGTVDSFIPCYAVDVAIFHAIKSIPEPLQHAYYARLDQWRREVQRRRQVQSEEQQPRHDLILAELIEQEERYFWKKNANRNRALVRCQQTLLFVGEVAMCMAVASVSAVGLSVLARRR